MMDTLNCDKRKCTSCQCYLESRGEFIDHKCTRTAIKQCDPVTGQVTYVYKTLRYCESERSPISLLNRIFGYTDKCLPEGKYFKMRK